MARVAVAGLAAVVVLVSFAGGAQSASRMRLELVAPEPGVIGPNSFPNGGPIYVPGRHVSFSFRLEPATPSTQGTVVYGQRYSGGAWHTLGHGRCTYEGGFRSCVGGFTAKFVPPPGYSLYRACLSPRGARCTGSNKAFVGRLHLLTDLTPVAHSDDYSVGPLVTGRHRWPKTVTFHGGAGSTSFVEYDLRGTCPYVQSPTSADDSFAWDDGTNQATITLQFLLDGVKKAETGIGEGTVGTIGDGVKTDWGAQRLRIVGTVGILQPTGSGPKPNPYANAADALGGTYGLMPAGNAICTW